MNLSSKIRVAVLRGGPSNEYDVSLKSGGHVLASLREMPEVYVPLDIFISRDGEWHSEGLVQEPQRILRHVDIVWNALHGAYGEDGQVQRLLDSLQIPYTGSGALASALSMNKEMAKRLYKQHGLFTPNHVLISQDELSDDLLIRIFRSYLHPIIIKPTDSGSSLGVELAHDFIELKNKIKKTLENSKKVLVEEFIKGKETTCGVVEGLRGEKLYAFLPTGRLSVDQNKSVEALAKQAHEILGLDHYSSSDFIVTPKSKIYILETDSLPAFHKESLLQHSLKAVGLRSAEFIHHVLQLAT